MFPKKFEAPLFGLILSGLMSLLVSGIATLKNAGFSPAFAGQWTSAWLMAWLIAFPVVMVVAPFTRKVVKALLVD